jgi:hypothetical protein
MQRAEDTARHASALVRTFHATVGSVGGVYLVTHSVTVTAIGAVAASIVTGWVLRLARYRSEADSSIEELVPGELREVDVAETASLHGERQATGSFE